ncbi:SOUL family heme-binding protein [Fusibacter bizertensis]
MGKYESPSYKVLTKDGIYEVREYDDFYVVEYDNEFDPEINQGFGTLFNYISSGNEDKMKIAMTVPVFEEVTGDKKKMAFVVPGNFGENIPKPNNSHLSVKKFDQGLFATVTYSGFSNNAKEEKMKLLLENWLKSKGYTGQSNYILALYNPPFVPPMFRKNEIIIRIKKR